MEHTIKQKLSSGAENFNRQEVNALLDALSVARECRDRYRKKLHSCFRNPFAYYNAEDGLQLKGGLPIPEGSKRLYEKPQHLEIPSDYRVCFKDSKLIKIDDQGLVTIKRVRGLTPRQAVKVLMDATSRISNEHTKFYFAEELDKLIYGFINKAEKDSV